MTGSGPCPAVRLPRMLFKESIGCSDSMPVGCKAQDAINVVQTESPRSDSVPVGCIALDALNVVQTESSSDSEASGVRFSQCLCSDQFHLF